MINKKSALSRKVLTTTGSLLLTGAASLHADSEKLEELEETTITATGYSTKLNETGLQVHVEDSGEINTLGIWKLNEAMLRSPDFWRT